MAPSRFEDDSMCFACGKANADGLQMEFESVGDEVRSRVDFPRKFQGYSDVVHGGLVSTVLDETMATVLNRMGYVAVTADLSVRFREPVRIAEKVDITASLIEKRGKVFRLKAEARRDDGTVLATAEARFFQVGTISEEEPG